MTLKELYAETRSHMQKSLEVLEHNLAGLRTGRANPGMFHRIAVDYYGTPTAINQVANLTLLDARTITVTPWEKKMLAPVEKAIRESDLGLNPSTHGDMVRVPMPALTEERRKDLINRGGEKISPREIDEILMDHPSVGQVVCFGIPHEKLGEEVGAAVVLREGHSASEKELRDHVASRVADFKVPRKILLLDEIPKGATGKLQRIGMAQKLGLA